MLSWTGGAELLFPGTRGCNYYLVLPGLDYPEATKNIQEGLRSSSVVVLVWANNPHVNLLEWPEFEHESRDFELVFREGIVGVFERKGSTAMR